MVELTKKRPAYEMITLLLRVHRSDAERIKGFVTSIEAEKVSEPRPWREVINELRPDDRFQSAIFRGSRGKAEVTKAQLSEMTGIPRRHLSEMEHGKRTIGKETARKLSKALNCDYRVLL